MVISTLSNSNDNTNISWHPLPPPFTHPAFKWLARNCCNSSRVQSTPKRVHVLTSSMQKHTVWANEYEGICCMLKRRKPDRTWRHVQEAEKLTSFHRKLKPSAPQTCIKYSETGMLQGPAKNGRTEKCVVYENRAEPVYGFPPEIKRCGRIEDSVMSTKEAKEAKLSPLAAPHSSRGDIEVSKRQ